MHIYLAIKYYPNGENRPIIEQLSTRLASAGHQITCVVRDVEAWGEHHFTPDELMRRSCLLIDRADLVLVELSEKGVGVGIEAGYAHAQGIPVAIIAQTGADISATLQGIACATQFYDDPTTLDLQFFAGLTTPVGRSTWDYITSSVDRLLTGLDGLDAAALNWRPLPTANSLFVLATHIVGNIEETVGGVICGQPVARNREAEFQATGITPTALQQHWATLRQHISAQLRQMSGAELAALRRHPRRGPMSANQILVVVARHAAEHLAQAELNRDLLLAAQPPATLTEMIRPQ